MKKKNAKQSRKPSPAQARPGKHRSSASPVDVVTPAMRRLIQKRATEECWVVDPLVVAAQAEAVVRRKYRPGKRRFASFLKGVFRNLKRSHSRRVWRRGEKSQPIIEAEDFVDLHAEDPRAESIRRLDLEVLRNMLDRVWPKLSFVDGYLLWLRFWLDRTIPEIASLHELRRHGVTESAIKCRLARVYTMLRDDLRAFAPQEDGCARGASARSSDASM